MLQDFSLVCLSGCIACAYQCAKGRYPGPSYVLIVNLARPGQAEMAALDRIYCGSVQIPDTVPPDSTADGGKDERWL